ncbi:hypothetical protein GALL_356770 [mine drainage metagenome]|uniref:Uncharacterized protein n=1 Tax=mine drainage metagenome TaxID=410659 RepID=A0A1J5QRN4_9ZZZZ
MHDNFMFNLQFRPIKGLLSAIAELLLVLTGIVFVLRAMMLSYLSLWFQIKDTLFGLCFVLKMHLLLLKIRLLVPINHNI